MLGKLTKSLLKKEWLFALIACGVLASSSLTAQESSENLRPELGSRALSFTEMASRADQRGLEDASEEEVASEEDTSDQLIPVRIAYEKRDLSDQAEDLFVAEPQEEHGTTLAARAALRAKAVYYTTHSGVYRNPNFVWSDGSRVELDDGSVWYVSVFDRALTLNWWTNDTILIMPTKYDSLYQYKLVNQQTGAYVRVNLEKAPYYNGAYTYFITAIDYFAGKVWLNDGTVWSTAFSDSSYTDLWLPNDTVIMGINDGSLWDLYPNILINISTLEYSRAKCLY